MPLLASFEKLLVGKSKELPTEEMGQPSKQNLRNVDISRGQPRKGALVAGLVFVAGTAGLVSLSPPHAEAKDGSPPLTATTRPTSTPTATLTPFETRISPTARDSRTPTPEATKTAPSMAEVQKRLGMKAGAVYQADCTNVGSTSDTDCVAAVASGAKAAAGKLVPMWVGIAGGTLNQWGLQLTKPTFFGSDSVEFQIKQMNALPRMELKSGSKATATACADGTVKVVLHFIASGGQVYDFALNFDPVTGSYGNGVNLLKAVQAMAKDTGVTLTKNGTEKYLGK